MKFRESIDKDSFRMGDDPKQEWVRQTNRARKLKEEIRAQRAEVETKTAAEKAELEATRAHVEKTVESVRHISDMWAAVNRKDAAGNWIPDFDTADEAFRLNTGVGLDDYLRARSRRGVANPEVARLRAENARLLRATQANGAAPPPAAPAGTNGAAVPTANGAVSAAPEATKAAAPVGSRNPEEFWGGEVPADHPLRQLNGWAKDLDIAMMQFHDDVLDEYSRDAEEVANEVLAKRLAKLGAAPAAIAPAPTTKPKTPRNKRPPAPAPGGIPNPAELTPRGQVNHDRSHRPTTHQDLNPEASMAERERWALDRAARHLRGEKVYDD